MNNLRAQDSTSTTQHSSSYGGFIYLKGDCPKCGGARKDKDCRKNTSTGIIHCRDTGDNPSYLYIGEDAIGFAMWQHVEDRDRYKEEKSQEYREEQKRQKEARLQELASRTAASLSPEERDKEIRKILAQLPLDRDHKEKIKERGLTDEQIDAADYRTVEPWQKLSKPIDEHLAGIKLGGRSMLNHARGIFCPIKDIHGYLVGFQIRFDNPKEGERRYTWLPGDKQISPKPSSHLPNGELPLAFYGEPNEEGIVGLAEGTSFKPYIASLRLNIPVIGAAGGNWASSPEILKQGLKALNATKVRLYVDAGALTNKNILVTYDKTIKLVESLGYQVEVACWGQNEKSDGDIDEISLETLTKIQYLTPDEFFSKTELKLPRVVVTSQQRKAVVYSNTDKYLKDNINDVEYAAYLAWEEEQEKINEAIEQERLSAKAPTFIENLKAQLLKLPRKWFKGFGTSSKDLESIPTPELPSKIFYDPDKSLPTPQDYEGKPAPFFIVKPDDAPRFLIAAMNAGWKDIVDQSPTGSGKSYSVGLLRPENGKHWYIDVNHNNPSTKTIADNYTNLQARHNGLTRGKDGKLKRSYSAEDEIEVRSNCHLADVFNQVSEKNIDCNQPTDKAINPICESCSFSYLCPNSEGDSYGYRLQRRNALGATLIRADIRSLPGPDDYDFSKDLFFIEEGTQSLDLLKTVTASLKDFDGLFADLEQKAPEIHQQLKPLRLALRPFLTKEEATGKYGLNTKDILAKIGNPPTYIEDIIENLEKLVVDLVFEKPPSIALTEEEKRLKNTNPKSYEAKKGLNAMARRQDKSEYFKAFLDKLKNLYSNWLIPLLKVWSGDKGAIRMAWEELEITYRNQRTIEILKGGRGRVWLDATPNITLIATAMEINPNSILRFTRVVAAPKNLTIKPIEIKGIGSRDWTETAKERVKAISQEISAVHPNLIEIGYKKHTEELDLDGWWGNHNRGTNAFIGQSVITFYGLPTPNIGQVEDEYLSLFGNLEGFEEYYQSLVQAEVVQALGRQRANLDPQTPYTIYLVASFKHFDPFSLASTGCVVAPIMEGCQITPEAGDKAQQKKYQSIEVLLKAFEAGQDIRKMSQAKIAEQLGICQQRVSQLMKQFQGGANKLKNLLISLYESLNRETSKISIKDLIQKSQELREWLELPPILETEGLLHLAEELEKVPEAAKLALIETYILNSPHPLITLGHLFGLITQQDTGQVVVT